MTLRTLLQDGDPLANDPGLAPEDVERIRRRVVAAEARLSTWSRSFRVALAAAVVLAGTAGAWWGRAALPARPGPAASDAAHDRDVNASRRQLQFATPGGTRVIWVFDSNFDMR